MVDGDFLTALGIEDNELAGFNVGGRYAHAASTAV